MGSEDKEKLSSMSLGFLGVGAICEDNFLHLPYFPEEDQKLRATDLTTRLGGNLPNTLNVLSQKCTRPDRLIFLSSFAERETSRRLTDQLTQKSVQVVGIWRDCPENPRSWILKSEQTGSRTIVNYNGVRELGSDELVGVVTAIDNKQGINWVHFEGRIPDVLITAIPKVRALLPHATISIEFEKPHREGLLDLLPFPDVAFFSHSYLKHFHLNSATELFQMMRHKNPRATFILTAGSEGAYYCTPDLEGAVPTRTVSVVDATGAGDTFIAGFIWASQKLGKDIKTSIEFAVNLATTKVAREGFEGVWEGYLQSTGL